MSASGILRIAWRELRQRPNVVVLAFWYLFLGSLFEYLFLARLGPQLPVWLLHPTPQNLAAANVRHLPAALVVRLSLVYCTFICIITPLGVGGLYGGAAAALKGEPIAGLLAFWRYAWRNFFRALGLVLALVVVLAVSLTVVGVATGWAGGVVGDAVMVLIMAFLPTAVLYGTGAMFFGREPPFGALGGALRWTLRHWWLALRITVLLLATLVVAMLVVTALAALPALGPVLVLLAAGVLLSFLSIFASTLYREAVRHEIPVPPV